MNDLDYLKLSKPQKLVHKLKEFIISIPRRLFNAIKGLILWFVNLFKKIGQGAADLVTTYVRGDWKTKVSYTIMGFGSMARGQWMRGIMFFVFQTVFNWYMYAMGLGFIKGLLTLGTVETKEVNRVMVYGDNSFLILLYGVLSIFFVLAFLVTWYINIKQNKMSEKLLKAGKKLKTAKDDVKSMLDGQFHKTLLALPTLGVTVFTILPIIFMILVAFTNYNEAHQPPNKLFSWVGTENFQTLLTTKQTDFTAKLTSKSVAPYSLELNATNGDAISLKTNDTDAAKAAVALTQQPTAKLSLSKKPLEYTGTFKEEKHQFRLKSTLLNPIDFSTSKILYSSPEIDLLSFIDEKLTAFVSEDSNQSTLLTLSNGDQYIVLTVQDETYAERIKNRINGKGIELTLTDPLHANFTLVDTPSSVAHQLIVEKGDVIKKIYVNDYAASSAEVTVSKLAKQSPVITLENNVLNMAGADGSFINLTVTDAAAAKELADFCSAADPAATTAKDKLKFTLLTFDRYRLTVTTEKINEGKTEKNKVEVTGFATASSGTSVTPESVAARCKANYTLTAEETDKGITRLKITFDNGDWISLDTLEASKANNAVLACTPPEPQNEADTGASIEAGTGAPADDTTEAPENENAVPPAVITVSMSALPSYYDVHIFSDKGEPVTLTGFDMHVTQKLSISDTFKHVLLWTLIWAFFATFLNYFLGMLVAIMINKKGIKLKKLWRTILVMTIAIPQFISLLYVSKMFAADGLINGMLMNWGWIKEPLPFWTDPTWARVTIIGINIWIGIPYLMLIATGILMNIPADLYESARIDGANAFQTYRKITLPYMLFVTGPYLLTSFTGNINNFNVIYLLSQGKPTSLVGLAENAGSTDLLITWLYKMTVTADEKSYNLAAVIGILVFIVCAVINLIVYNLIPSVKNEEDFQ